MSQSLRVNRIGEDVDFCKKRKNGGFVEFFGLVLLEPLLL